MASRLRKRPERGRNSGRLRNRLAKELQPLKEWTDEEQTVRRNLKRMPSTHEQAGPPARTRDQA